MNVARSIARSFALPAMLGILFVPTRSRAQAVLSDMFDPLRGGPTGVG